MQELFNPAVIPVPSGKDQVKIAHQSAIPPADWLKAAPLERALNNLLDNALCYAESNSTIRLQVESPRPEIIPKLFDRLFRADSSRHSEGSGLGLSIVKAIADAHQGVVSVQSDPETRRTRFILSLPRFQAR